MNQSPTPIETGSLERIEIPLNKKKIILILLGVIISMIIEIIFIISPNTISESIGYRLTTGFLSCKHNELERILREQYEKYGNYEN